LSEPKLIWVEIYPGCEKLTSGEMSGQRIALDAVYSFRAAIDNDTCICTSQRTFVCRDWE